MPAIAFKNSDSNNYSDEQSELMKKTPQAIEAEKSLLSTLLRHPQECLAQAIEEGLTDLMFYLPAHQIIYENLIIESENPAGSDLISFTQKLEDKNLLDKVGGAANLTKIYGISSTRVNFLDHLSIVKQKYLLRQIIHECTDAIGEAYDNPEEPEDLLNDVEGKILNIRKLTENRDEQSVKAVVSQVWDNLSEALNSGGAISGISTGYKDLDILTNGLKPAEMIVLAARPSRGKTSLMMNIIEHVCVDQGIPSLVFSCEMPTLQIVDRLVFSKAKFDKSKISKGFNPSREELQSIRKAATAIGESNLFIDDTPSMNIQHFRAIARRKKQESDIKFIAIDYLQLMRSSSKQATSSREREIAEISAGIKAVAKELNVPIIVLAQLNRDAEKDAREPRMSDLRESGAIEQDADLVTLLCHDSDLKKFKDQNAEDTQGRASLIVAKNRNGATGIVPLTFIKEYTRFETRAWSKDEQDE